MPSVRELFLKRFGRCPVKGCKNAADEKNHVLYDYHNGGPQIVNVCAEHHSWFTRANTQLAHKQGTRLTEKQRLSNWSKLIKGEMKKPPETDVDRKWKENRLVDSC